ncbi:hypothetical protein DYB38_014047, partial [Aphanomyces astaci]
MAPPRRRANKKAGSDSYANLSADERKQQGGDAKTRGNAAYSSGDFATAIKEFTTAIAYEPHNHAYFSNRSAAYLNNGNAAAALQDANKCIEIDAKWSKGYARLGAAYYYVKSYEKAISAYTKGLSLEKGNKQLQAGLTQAQAALQVLEEEQSGVDMDDATRKLKQGDKPLIEVSFRGEAKSFTPEEISSMVLTRMKETAENYLGQEIKQAVVT